MITEIIQVSQFFLESITEEDNSHLKEEVMEEELKVVTAHSFRKDKIQGPDGWKL